MATKFKVPKCLEDLTEPPSDDEEHTLYAQDVIEIDSLDDTESHRLVAAVATQLAEKDVLCVLEQSVFDQLYSLVRGYAYLEASQKSIFIDSLCTNFVQLNVSTSILTKSMEDSSSEDAEDVIQQSRAHCNAIKIYAYFLLSILTVEEAEPESSTQKSAGNRGGSKGGRSRKKHVPQDWDWSIFRTRTLRVLAGALQNNLQLIFESRQLDEGLISSLAKAAFKMLENRALLEKGDCKQVLYSIISACTGQYGYGISSVVTIIDMLHKFEHLPAHIADLVSLVENQYSGSSMAVDLLRAVGQIDPKYFERDNAGAKNVGLFLEELAIRRPKIVVTNLSIILCHLDGKSYKMRNSLVKVIGTLLVEAVKEQDGIRPSDVTRLRNEQALLNVLIERSRDVSAHTRKHVLQTWAYLCKEHAVPIGHWNLVSELAAGRLEDSAAIVRKNALQLLATLLEYNPFGPSLRAAAFETTFEKYNEKLAVMSPDPHPVGEEVDKNLERTEPNVEGELPNDKTVDSSDGARTALDGEEPHSQPEHNNSPQARQPTPDPPFSTEIGGLEHTRALVASLESALRFSKCIGSTMDTLAQLLASSGIGDVESTIQLLILCKKFEVDGSGSCLRKTLPLVFSREERITLIVEEAFQTLYLRGSPSEVASNLVNLTLEASLGDLASIDALVSKSMSKREISPGTVSALWDFFTFNAQGSTAEQSRAALTVLCMAAKSSPHILSSHLQNIMDIGFGRWAKDDVLLARCACIALQRLPESDRASFRRNHKIFSILSNLIVGPGLSEACWYSAAEQSINAIYALHPAPERFSSGLLVKLAQSVFSRIQRPVSRNLDADEADIDQHQPQDFSSLSAVAVSRFLFAVAHVALKHLVYIEFCLKVVRKQRGDREKAAANEAAEKLNPDGGIATSKEENIAAELGLAASEDAKLDDLMEQAETELINGDSTQKFLIGAIAPMVARLCLNSTLMQQNQRLRSSAMLALCKLMVIDASFCEKHLQLLFTIAQNSLEDSVRSNCIIALGDLALRFPNLLEPWMESIYARVHDQSIPVRKNTVLVLSHLILNDLIKVKGYISEMAMHLEDEDPRISDLVKLFFHELSKKGNNPINNLLPDILSRLSSNPALSQDHFNLIMQFLIGTIKKTKQMEGLIDKFCNRFVGNSDVRQWQDIAYCLCQLSYSQSCLKKLADHFKLYQHALGDVGVVDHFKALIVKTRKLAAADVKLLLDEFEEKITNWHNEKREQETAWQKAQEHQQRAEALKAQYSGKLNDSRNASQDEDLGTETGKNDRVVDEEEREEETMTRVTIVKRELIDEGLPPTDSSTWPQSNEVDGEFGDFHAELEVTTTTVVRVEEEAVDAVPRKVEMGTGQPDQDVDDVDHVNCEELNGAVQEQNLERRNRLLDEELSAVRGNGAAKINSTQGNAELPEPADSTQSSTCEEELNGTQPYPYMDLDLESALTQESAESAGNAGVVEAKKNESKGSDESEVEDPNFGGPKVEHAEVKVEHEVAKELSEKYEDNGKENPNADGEEESDQNSGLTSDLRSPELTQTARTRTLRRLKKVGGVPSQKATRSSSGAKVERSSEVHERIAGRHKVLKPRNETVWR